MSEFEIQIGFHSISSLDILGYYLITPQARKRAIKANSQSLLEGWRASAKTWMYPYWGRAINPIIRNNRDVYNCIYPSNRIYI